MNTLISNYYTKSIRLTPDGFSLYTQSENEEIVQQHFATDSGSLITNEAPKFFDFEHNEAQVVEIVVATAVPMLIPDIIYKDEQACEYLQMQNDISQFGRHYTDRLSNYRSLYFLTQNECSTIDGLACTPRFKSEATILYNFLVEQDKPSSIILSVNDHFVDIISLHGKEPSLVNRITRTDPVDILYYSLNCMQQFGMTAPTLFIQYFTKPNKKLNELLCSYYKDVIFL